MKHKKQAENTSFFSKVLSFFSSLYDTIKSWRLFEKINDRERRLAGYMGNAPTENCRAAYFFGILKVAFVTLFVALAIIVMIFGGKSLSYDNVYYMFRDIGYISSFSEGRPEASNYSKPISKQCFISFKNGIAVASDSELKFFTATGRVTLTEGSKYVNPIISCSDDHALIYDGGRNEFTIYNSFTELYSEKLEHPISLACMSQDGSFAVVTRSNKYSSVVRMYDSNFSLVREYFKNDYIISIVFSKNGKELVVVSLDASSGESVTTVNIIKTSTGKVSSTVTLSGVMPYKCSFIDDDRILLVCHDRTLVLDGKGRQKRIIEYPSGILNEYTSSDRFALVFKGDGLDRSNTVVIYDADGKRIYSKNIDGKIVDFAFDRNYLYILLEREILKIDIRLGVVSDADAYEGAKELLILSNGEVVICTEAAAYYPNFK